MSLLLRVVQRVVEPRDRARGVAERRMRGDVLDPLAVDLDLAAVAQAFEIFRAGERPALRGDHVFVFASLILPPILLGGQ